MIGTPAGRQRTVDRVKGELRGLAPVGVDDVHLLIAAVLPREGDLGAVRGKLRIELQPRVAGQATGRFGAVDVGQPQVAGIAEDEPGSVDVRETEHAGAVALGRLVIVRRGGGAEGEKQQAERTCNEGMKSRSGHGIFPFLSRCAEP